MKIEITRNASAFRTSDLRKLIRLACKAVGAKRDKRFHIGASRRHNVISGRAYIGTRGKVEYKPVWLTIGKDCTLEEIARTIAHELMHSVGVSHRDMTPEQRKCTQPVPWAEGFELRRKKDLEPAKAQSETPAERGARLVAKREAHARAMLKRAITRRKRAESVEKKWREKVCYYERRTLDR